MAHPTRILYVTGEVEPFAKVTDVASLARLLPEQLQDTGDFEARIMMPRYGTISERKNRLHEVIRLSGTDIPMGSDSHTLKVKVASIPGIRLQVYFMDNNHFFKRKGLHTDKKGHLFEDNTERALFFGRAVLETLRNLRWGPDVIHACGWITSFIPMLLATEYADDELFADTKIIYTPCGTDLGVTLTEAFVADMKLSLNGEVTGLGLHDVGHQFADFSAHLPEHKVTVSDSVQLSLEQDELTEQAILLYDRARSEVAA